MNKQQQRVKQINIKFALASNAARGVCVILHLQQQQLLVAQYEASIEART